MASPNRRRTKPKNNSKRDSTAKELWVKFTQDAIAHIKPEEEGSPIACAEVASEYADAMLEEFEWRFENGAVPQHREDEDEEDEDD